MRPLSWILLLAVCAAACKKSDDGPDPDTAVPETCSPVELGLLPLNDWAYDVKVSGDLAFVADDGFGLTVVDVSDPEQPVQVGALPMVRHAIRLQLVDELLYVSTWERGLSVVDVSNPAFPRTVGSIALAGPTSGFEVDGTLGVVAGMESGLYTVDLTDPTHPVLLGTLPVPNSPENWVRDVVIQGDRALVAVGGLGMWVVDLSDPTNPTLLGETDRNGWMYSIEADGDLAWVSDAAFGLRLYDVSDPTDPTLLTTHYVANGAVASQLVGNTLYLTTWSDGVHVLDVTDPLQPVEHTSFAHSTNLAVDVVGDRAYVASASDGLRVIELCEDTGVAAGPTPGTPGPRTPSCGDAITDPGEQCDDADRNDGDGCSATCQLEAGWGCDTTHQPTLCTNAVWHLGGAAINPVAGIADQDLRRLLPTEPLRLAAVSTAVAFSQGLDTAVLSEGTLQAVDCGSPYVECDASLPLALPSTGGVALLMDDAGDTFVPTVSSGLSERAISRLNPFVDYWGDEYATVFTTTGIRTLSVAVGEALGETWGPDELLCRGPVITWANNGVTAHTGSTIDLRGLPAHVLYFDQAAGEGPDGDLGTADDDLAAYFTGSVIDDTGFVLIVPDAPCGSTQPTRAVVAVREDQPSPPYYIDWEFYVSWLPGAVHYLDTALEEPPP